MIPFRSHALATLAVMEAAMQLRSRKLKAGPLLPSLLDPRRGEFRKGRRFNYGFPIVPKPGTRWSGVAGAKLAKQAAKGTLTHCRIR